MTEQTNTTNVNDYRQNFLNTPVTPELLFGSVAYAIFENLIDDMDEINKILENNKLYVGNSHKHVKWINESNNAIRYPNLYEQSKNFVKYYINKIEKLVNTQNVRLLQLVCSSNLNKNKIRFTSYSLLNSALKIEKCSNRLSVLTRVLSEWKCFLKHFENHGGYHYNKYCLPFNYNKIAVPDNVQVCLNEVKLRNLFWVNNLKWDPMYELKCGQKGVISDIHGRGTVKVVFSDKSWLWIPKLALVREAYLKGHGPYHIDTKSVSTLFKTKPKNNFELYCRSYGSTKRHKNYKTCGFEEYNIEKMSDDEFWTNDEGYIYMKEKMSDMKEKMSDMKVYSIKKTIETVKKPAVVPAVKPVVEQVEPVVEQRVTRSMRRKLRELENTVKEI